MEKMSQKLLISDYYQYFTYPLKKRLLHLYREHKLDEIAFILDQLIVRPIQQIELATDITAITIFDAQYPTLLLESYDPPLVLYCKGNIALLEREKKLAIVGSRYPKHASKVVLHSMFEDLLTQQTNDLVIVSGLATGIDGMSHQLSLTHNMSTIAVLGFGFNYMYPAQHQILREQIIQYGLVISEYPPHIPINKWQFIARNRIISGLCKAVIIVEAKRKSGSLITAELALSENREVYIVGGQSYDKAYDGSHTLIQEGAKLLINMEEVLAEYSI